MLPKAEARLGQTGLDRRITERKAHRLQHHRGYYDLNEAALLNELPPGWLPVDPREITLVTWGSVANPQRFKPWVANNRWTLWIVNADD